MDAVVTTQRQWFRAAAIRLVACQGVDKARRVVAYHRRSPMPGADCYPDMIEQAIESQERTQ
jgi:hypothetical protein